MQVTERWYMGESADSFKLVHGARRVIKGSKVVYIREGSQASHIKTVCAFWYDDCHGCGVQVLQDATRVRGVQQAVAEDRICDCADVPATPAAAHTTIMISKHALEGLPSLCMHQLLWVPCKIIDSCKISWALSWKFPAEQKDNQAYLMKDDCACLLEARHL